MPSLRRTRKKLQRQVVRWTIWITITIIFVLGMFSGFTWVERQVRGVNLPRDLAKVNGVAIPRKTYEEALLRLSQQRMSALDWLFTKEQVFWWLVEEELLRQEAYRRRLRVTRKDINQRLEELVQRELASARQQYERDKDFRDFVRQRFGSLDALARETRRSLRQQSADLEQELLKEKLFQSVREEVKVTEEDLKAHYTQFRLRHLFVSADRFLPKGKTPSDQERREALKKALERAKELRERLLKGEDLAALARKESDDPATKQKGGDLGELSLDAAKWRISPQIEELLPKMKVGDLSEPIEGFNGYHLVKLEGKRLNLPDDYNKVRYQCQEEKCRHFWLGEKGETKCPKCASKNVKELGERKQELLDELRERLVREREQELRQRLRQTAHLEIYDPELKALFAQRQGNTEEAVQHLKEALRTVQENPEARRHFLFPDLLHYQLSQLYLSQGKLKEAEQEVRKALEYSDDNDLNLQLGSLLLLQNKRDAALKVFLKVANSNPNPAQRYNLANYFEQLGRKDLAKQQRELANKESARTGALSLPLTLP